MNNYQRATTVCEDPSIPDETREPNPLETAAIKFQETVRPVIEMLEGFHSFVNSLSEIDRLNFTALIRLPNAVELLPKYPQDTEFQRDYKANALIAIALQNFSNKG